MSIKLYFQFQRCLLLLLIGNVKQKSFADNPEYYTPSVDEIAGAFIIQPPVWWGARMRLENSIRISFNGGSQTSDGLYIESFKEKFLSNKEFIDNKTELIVYNDGISGNPPKLNPKSFESLPKSKWPNIIVLEYSINCGAGWGCTFQLDDLIYYLQQKYDHHRIPRPYFMYIEFFTMGQYYEQLYEHGFFPSYMNTNQSLFTMIPLNDNNPNITSLSPPNTRDNINLSENRDCRGSAAGPTILELMRFHRIPVLSVKDALFPALTRFFSTHDRLDKFPFGGDGVHLGEYGCAWMAETLMIPFFLKQMKFRTTDSLYQDRSSIYDVDVRMFPPKFYSSHSELEHFSSYWTSWGAQIDPKHHLERIIIPNIYWNFIHTHYHEKDNKHICYGTYIANQVSRIKIPINEKLVQNIGHRLAIGFDYIHSWNISYSAHSQCRVYLYVEGSDYTTLPSHGYITEYINIIPNICERKKLHHTGPCEHHIHIPLSSQQTVITTSSSTTRHRLTTSSSSNTFSNSSNSSNHNGIDSTTTAHDALNPRVPLTQQNKNIRSLGQQDILQPTDPTVYYILECTNMEAEKLSCISAVQLLSTEEIDQ